MTCPRCGSEDVSPNPTNPNGSMYCHRCYSTWNPQYKKKRAGKAKPNQRGRKRQQYKALRQRINDLEKRKRGAAAMMQVCTHEILAMRRALREMDDNG